MALVTRPPFLYQDRREAVHRSLRVCSWPERLVDYHRQASRLCSESCVGVFNKGDSYDTIWDFSTAEGDKIRLDPAFGIATLADLQSHLSGFSFEGAEYTVISFPDSVDQLTIKGVASTSFTLALLDG